MSSHKARHRKESKSSNLHVAKEKQKLWFQNLIILKFPVRSMEEKCKMSFHSGMFDKPNKAGFEIIFHFLFSKLDKDKSVELFRSCYPVHSKKECQQFRTVCLNWWKRLSEEHPSFNLPRVTNTLLMSPTGTEVYRVLFSFSSLVLFMGSRKLDQIVNGKGSDNTIHPSFNNQAVEGLTPARVIGLKNATHSESIRMMHAMQISKQSDLKAKKLADSILQEYRDNNKLKKQLEQRKKELLNKLHISADKLSNKGTPSRNRTPAQILEKCLSSRTSNSIITVRRLWHNLLTAVRSTEEQREIVQSVLNLNDETKGLNAVELAPKVPAALLQQCTNQVYESVGTSLYEAGQLNLISLMKLFNLSLHLIIEKLHEVGVPNLESQLPYIKAQSQICQQNIRSLEEMRKKLERSAPETEKRIAELTFKVDEMHSRRESSLQYELIAGLPRPQFQSSEIEEHNCDDNELGILPLTPPFQFSDHAIATPLIGPENMETLREKLYNSSALPDDMPSMIPKIPTTIEATPTKHIAREVEDGNISDNSSSTLKQGALEIGLATSPKTSRRGGHTDQSLLRKRMLKQNLGKSSGLPRPVKKNLVSATKPSSLPSTPVAKPNDTTIEKITSRTPEAVRNLIDQVVDYTMLEMSVQPGYKPSDTSPVITGLTPALLDISSQLDMTVFETQNKIGRTPPDRFSYNSHLIPDPISKENINSNLSKSPSETCSDSSSHLSRTSEESRHSFENDNDLLKPPDTNLLKTPHQSNGPSAYAHMQFATPGILADIDFSQYPSIMDMTCPDLNTPDSFLDSLNMPVTPVSAVPDVPTGNLIDL